MNPIKAFFDSCKVKFFSPEKLICILLMSLITINPINLAAQQSKNKKNKSSTKRSKLSPEQKDLKRTASYLTDGRQFSDDETIELSRILKKIEFNKKWKEIKNKAEGNYPLNPAEKRIYRKILRRHEKVRHELNKFWEKKNRPKNKEDLKRHKAVKAKSNTWNKKKH